MNRIIHFKKLICFFTCFFFCFLGFAKDFSISITPLVLNANGTLNEYVYTHSAEFNTDFKLSELNWNIENYVQYGQKLSINKNHFGINYSFLAGGDRTSNVMYDSDWQNPDDLNMKTNFSISDNTITSFYNTSLSFLYLFNNWQYFEIAPSFTLNYYSINFEARNGYGWDGDSIYHNPPVSWNDKGAHYLPQGVLCGIDYSRFDFHFILGAVTTFKLWDRVFLSADLGFPVFSILNSLDTHYSNTKCTSGTCFNDRFRAAFTGVNVDVTLSIKIVDFLLLSGFFDYLPLKLYDF